MVRAFELLNGKATPAGGPVASSCTHLEHVCRVTARIPEACIATAIDSGREAEGAAWGRQ
jgi:hypothetical protein